MNVTRTERDLSQEPKRVKIAMNKSLLKEYWKDNERVVYLEDGNEFQIQIFNDQNTEIGAKIYVNDEQIGNSYLVINPGERVWLDRYLDKAKKFKFKTYEVNGNNEAVKKAIRNNGIVKVVLFRKSNPIYKNYNDWNLNKITVNPVPEYPHIYYSNEVYAGSSSSPVECRYSVSSLDLAENSNIQYTTGVSSSTFTTTATTTAGSGFVNINANLSKPNKMETGRISEGSYSDQTFEYVDIDFEIFAFDTETIHILPMSTKPVKATDLQKVYCTNCGRKLKQKFNYCPFCGHKIE